MALVAPKKLIEVALPLDKINKAAAREKTIRHGHPSTLHLWWARRPLAAARAVIFAQMVNDPSWKYSVDELKKPGVKSTITRKRNELFKLLSQLVQWESTTDEDVLGRARAAIATSWRETCEANGSSARNTLCDWDPKTLPPFRDPFAGGGAIPVEAQRLGLKAIGSDLNPVAVLINKAMLELPPRYSGQPPIGPLPDGDTQTSTVATSNWLGPTGLAEDVRRYGAWLRTEAERRIGRWYPEVKVTKEIIRARPDLEAYEGRALPVIAWLWARTVASPNPAAGGAQTPLVSSFMLSSKEGRESWVEIVIGAGLTYSFECRRGRLSKASRERLKVGTRSGKAQDFVCVYTGTPVTREYVREQGKAGNIHERLMAVALEGDRCRVYLDPKHATAPEPTVEQRRAAQVARSTFLSSATPSRAMITGGVCSAYGLSTWGSLFTDRQLTFLLTVCDLIDEVRLRVASDCQRVLGTDTVSSEGYGESIATYLAFALSRSVDRGSSLCSWDSSPKMEALRNTFGRQALPMVWDFAEGNPFSGSSGSWMNNIEWVSLAIEKLPAVGDGKAQQADAQTIQYKGEVVSTDPPYYDNIGYAELADFFYLWLRRALPWERHGLLATILTPKEDELVVAPHRRDSKAAADAYFLNGMTAALSAMASGASSAFPLTVYYAFKQSETDTEAGTASSGWESFLESCLRARLSVTATWPMRTELGNRLVGVGTNALASSIVLSMRPRPAGAPRATRKEFLRELDRTLPDALTEMTADPFASIAPVDLQQAAIGPGMAVFSKYEAVVEADGAAMTVHSALIHINKAIDDYFAHSEGELDADTRFCISWFQQYGVAAGGFGEADVLARAKGTAVDGLVEAGVVEAGRGKVRLLSSTEYDKGWDPTKDPRVPIWEACHQLCRALGESEAEAGRLLARMPDKQDSVRRLAYRLYTICERKAWAEGARTYNDLIASWPAIVEASQRAGISGEQLGLV